MRINSCMECIKSNEYGKAFYFVVVYSCNSSFSPIFAQFSDYFLVIFTLLFKHSTVISTWMYNKAKCLSLSRVPASFFRFFHIILAIMNERLQCGKLQTFSSFSVFRVFAQPVRVQIFQLIMKSQILNLVCLCSSWVNFFGSLFLRDLNKSFTCVEKNSILDIHKFSIEVFKLNVGSKAKVGLIKLVELTFGEWTFQLRALQDYFNYFNESSLTTQRNNWPSSIHWLM